MFLTDAECRELVSEMLQKSRDDFGTAEVPFEWTSAGVLALDVKKLTTVHGDLHALVAVLVTEHEEVLEEYVRVLGNMSQP